MRKMPTLYEREQVGRKSLAVPRVNPECQWVLDGEGRATEKFDGTCCAVIDGRLYARHALKEGKPMPQGWVHWSRNPEQRSGHGWRPVSDGPEDGRHRQAWDSAEPGDWADGTYELVGPKIQKNPYGLLAPQLWLHGSGTLDAPTGFQDLDLWLAEHYLEGVVWHHPDGRMAKIKRRDFDIPWPGKRRAAPQPEGGAE